MSQDMSDNLPAPREPGGIVFNYHGVDVNFDEDRLVCLNNMWKAAGSPENKDPRQWSRLPQSSDFVDEVARNLNVGKSHIWKSRRGKHLGGTWADWRIAVAYAEYLSPAFHLFVVEVFRRWHEEEFNPDIKVRRAVERYRQRGWGERRILARIEGIIRRHKLTDVLKEHGVEEQGYAACTNAIYEPLFGTTAQGLREQRGLTQRAALRDHFNTTELASVSWAETMALRCMQVRGTRGNAACEEACRRAAEAASRALKSLGINPDE